MRVTRAPPGPKLPANLNTVLLDDLRSIIYKLYVDNRERVASRELLLNELQECKLALRGNNLSELLSTNEESNKLLEQIRKELEEL